jgi:ribonuclease HI
MAEVVLSFDGACWPNPGGTATWGFVVRGPAGLDDSGSGVVAGPDRTNNVAEWSGLEMGLRFLAANPPRTPGVKLAIRGDSQLVVKVLNGEWASKSPVLTPFRDRCLDLLARLGLDWSASWVPRAENAEADRLTEEAWAAETGKPFPTGPYPRR